MLMAAELKQTPVISEELKNWVSTAASSGATDMHIEPYGEGLRVRLRVGGALCSRRSSLKPRRCGRPAQSDGWLATRKISRAKLRHLLCRYRRRQNGLRAPYHVPDTPWRPASSPFYLLEELASFDELGLNTDQIRTLSQTVSRRGGLTIVSGPGAPVSATLYVIARQLNREELHVVSIEEVIEREIPSTQTQIDEANGMDSPRRFNTRCDTIQMSLCWAISPTEQLRNWSWMRVCKVDFASWRASTARMYSKQSKASSSGVLTATSLGTSLAVCACSAWYVESASLQAAC